MQRKKGKYDVKYDGKCIEKGKYDGKCRGKRVNKMVRGNVKGVKGCITTNGLEKAFHHPAAGLTYIRQLRGTRTG